MAHFAEIDEQGVVLRVLVVPDEQEHRGNEYLADDLELGGTWVQTSYNHTIRKRFAGIGMVYHKELDAFIAPQPFPSWKLDETSAEWVAPKPQPENGSAKWNEEKQEWETVNV